MRDWKKLVLAILFGLMGYLSLLTMYKINIYTFIFPIVLFLKGAIQRDWVKVRDLSWGILAIAVLYIGGIPLVKEWINLINSVFLVSVQVIVTLLAIYEFYLYRSGFFAEVEKKIEGIESIYLQIFAWLIIMIECFMVIAMYRLYPSYFEIFYIPKDSLVVLFIVSGSAFLSLIIKLFCVRRV